MYLTWARIEKSATATSSFLSRTPIIVQYLFFLTLNALATLAHHLTVRTLSYVLVPRRVPAPGAAGRNNNTNVTEHVIPTSGQQHQQQHPTTSPSRLSQHEASLASASSPCLPAAAASASNTTSTTAGNHAPPPPHSTSPVLQPPPLRRVATAPSLNVQPLPPPTPASPTAISTALLVSSCAKLFPILLVIWGQDGSSSSSGGNNSKSVSTSYSQSRALTHIENTPSLIFARQHDIATPVATMLSLPGPPVSDSDSESGSVFERWINGLISMLPLSSSANHYLALISEFVGSMLSLGAADTHLVLLSNIEALYILLGCGYLRAVALAVAGLAARWTVQWVVLSAVGVG